MNIELKSKFEIDVMDEINILKEYLNYQTNINQIEMVMGFMKDRMKTLLYENKKERYSTSFGEFSVVTQKRNQFQQGVAKEFLSAEQIEKCYVKKEVSFVKVISAQAKGIQSAFMEMKE